MFTPFGTGSTDMEALKEAALAFLMCGGTVTTDEWSKLTEAERTAFHQAAGDRLGVEAGVTAQVFLSVLLPPKKTAGTATANESPLAIALRDELARRGEVSGSAGEEWR